MQVVNALGFSQKQAERFEILADNKDLVEQVKHEARENDDLPTRARVIDMAKARREHELNYYQKLDDGHDFFCKLSKIHGLIEKLDSSPQMLIALYENYDDVLTVDEEITDIKNSINKLYRIMKYLEKRLSASERK